MNRDDRRSSSAHIYSLASPTFLPSFLLFFFLSLSPFCSYRQLYYLIILFFRGDTRHAKSYLSPHAFNRSYPACFISLVIASQLSRSNIAKRYVPDIKRNDSSDIRGYQWILIRSMEMYTYVRTNKWQNRMNSIHYYLLDHFCLYVQRKKRKETKQNKTR